jgi:hypothetical protein
MFGRAMDLAFRTEQFSSLDLIAKDLNAESDPRVLERCAEFFTQNQQYKKAVELLGYAKKVRVSLVYNIVIIFSFTKQSLCALLKMCSWTRLLLKH